MTDGQSLSTPGPLIESSSDFQDKIHVLHETSTQTFWGVDGPKVKFLTSELVLQDRNNGHKLRFSDLLQFVLHFII